MRKLPAVAVLLLSGALIHAPDVSAGENVSFGVLGGLSRVDVSAEPEPDFPLSSRNRAHTGAFVQFELNESTSLVAQAMWLQKGTTLGADPTRHQPLKPAHWSVS